LIVALKIIDSLKKIKNFFVLVIPAESSAGAKSHKFSLSKITALFAAYTIIIAVLGYIFFSVTSLGDILIDNKKFSNEEIKKIEELNSRMLFLSRELESLKSTNERLRYAIMLGDSDLIKSLSKKDSLKKKSGGSILNVFRNFVEKLFYNPQQTIYFLKPVSGFISREFNSEKGHIGIDFVVKKGTSVFSAADGFVIFSDYSIEAGNMIIINHNDGYISVYKHCSLLLKKPREEVKQGELIALSGNSGETTTGPHLHFEIWKDGQPVDPKSLFINQ
jgi:hypothetical protein